MRDRKLTRKQVDNDLELSTILSSDVDLTIPAIDPSVVNDDVEMPIESWGAPAPYLSFEFLSIDVIIKICLMLAPEDIHALLTSHCYLFLRFSENRKQQIWKNKFNLYFLEHAEKLKTDPNVNWYQQFKQDYKKYYKPLPTRARWLYTWIKEHDIEALNKGRELSTRVGKAWKAKTVRVKIGPLQCSDIMANANNTTMAKFVRCHRYQGIFDLMYSKVSACDHQSVARDPKQCNLLAGRRKINFAVMFNQVERVRDGEFTSEEIKAKVVGCGSILNMAIRDHHIEMLNELLVRGADPNMRNGFQETPLHVASRKGVVAAVEALLLHGANYDVLNANGRPPINFATEKRHLEVVKLLIAAGANHSVRGYSDLYETPIETAIRIGSLNITRVLIAANCVVDHRTLQMAINFYNRHIALEVYQHWISKQLDADDYDYSLFTGSLFGIKFSKLTVKQKESAAAALLKVINKEAEVETLIEHLPALNEGYLSHIFKKLALKVPSANKLKK